MKTTFLTATVAIASLMIGAPVVAETWGVYATDVDGVTYSLDIDSVTIVEEDQRRPIEVYSISSIDSTPLLDTYYCNDSDTAYDSMLIEGQEFAVGAGTIGEVGRDIACEIRAIMLQTAPIGEEHRDEAVWDYLEWQVFQDSVIETGDIEDALYTTGFAAGEAYLADNPHLVSNNSSRNRNYLYTLGSAFLAVVSAGFRQANKEG